MAIMNAPLLVPPTLEEMNRTFVEAVRIFTGDLAEAPTVHHVAALAAAADELAARIDPVYAARLDQLVDRMIDNTALDRMYDELTRDEREHAGRVH